MDEEKKVSEILPPTEILAGVKYLHYCCPVCYNQSCSRKMLEPEEVQTND